MRKTLVAAVVALAGLVLASPISAQHVKTNGANPNPIREYGKLAPMPGPTSYRVKASGGAHRAA